MNFFQLKENVETEIFGFWFLFFSFWRNFVPRNETVFPNMLRTSEFKNKKAIIRKIYKLFSG